MTEFGKYLRKMRIDREEVLYGMSKNLNVSAAYLSSIENGTKSAPAELVEKIIEIYELEPKQADELRRLAELTAKQIQLNLVDVEDEKRDLALAIAKRFDTMGRDEVKKLLGVLGEAK